MKFARITFWSAALYGILITLPMFFTEAKLNAEYPPPITHAEYYYSFAGLLLVWQLLFIFIGSDPVRYRPMMIISVMEKLSLLPGFLILFPRGRFPQLWFPLLLIDLAFAILFAISFYKSKAVLPAAKAVS